MAKRDWLAIGMNEHVAKPFKVEALFSTLTHWINPTATNKVTDEAIDITKARASIRELDTLYELTKKAGQDYWAVLVDSQRNTVCTVPGCGEKHNQVSASATPRGRQLPSE